MISHLDVYRSASAIIKRYGDGAIAHAAMRVDALFKEDDLSGSAIWSLILRAVKEMLANERLKYWAFSCAGPSRMSGAAD